MKKILFSAVLCAAVSAMAEFGTPTVTSIVPDASNRTVSVTYSLSGDEPAIVTMTVTTGGKTYDAVSVVGDVNCRVSVGAGKTVTWHPQDDIPVGTYDVNALSVQLKAWSTSTPPDYMAVSLLAPKCVKYYVSSNAVPGGVLDPRWKEDWLLMRRIPAKGVAWRMGCASSDYCWSVSEQNDTYGFQPLHYVTNAVDYYIGVYEVTQGQYKRLANGAEPSTVGQNAFSSLSTASHRILHQTDWKWHPVETVSWAMATNAVATLAVASGLSFGLPTQEQWEFAGRGATQWGTYNGAPHNPDHISPIGVCYQVQNTYYGGAQNVAHPQYACHLPVGSKRPNAYGLYDMIGNICEWCSGWFDVAETLRPVRGGELHMSGEGLGVGYCRGKVSTLNDYRYGFRLACTIP